MRIVGRVIKTKKATYKVIERETYFGREGYWVELISGYMPHPTLGRFEIGDQMHMTTRFVENKIKGAK